MRSWISRLEDLEKRAALIHSEEQFDQWIETHAQGSEISYYKIMSQVPNHLKEICLERAMRQLAEMQKQEVSADT